MPLRIDCSTQGEEDRGPIALEASLARPRAALERAAGAQATTITPGLAAIFSARQAASGPDWDPDGALGRISRAGPWVVYAPGTGTTPRTGTPPPPGKAGRALRAARRRPGATRGREGV